MLLAAGMSRRMRGENKLLAEIDGAPMVRHVAEAMVKGGIRELVVVTGHEADAVTAALSDLEAPGMVLRFVHNADFASGQAGSVATGVSALSNDVSGALIALGDMPFVSADLVAEMIQDHSGLGDQEMRISFPVYEGRRGNPVLWGRGFFEALAGLSGDIGGRRILAENPAAVNSISWTDDSIHNDIDTGDDLRRHLRG